MADQEVSKIRIVPAINNTCRGGGANICCLALITHKQTIPRLAWRTRSETCFVGQTGPHPTPKPTHCFLFAPTSHLLATVSQGQNTNVGVNSVNNTRSILVNEAYYRPKVFNYISSHPSAPSPLGTSGPSAPDPRGRPPVSPPESPAHGQKRSASWFQNSPSRRGKENEDPHVTKTRRIHY
ncbi:hypothetical protein B0H10DRAFT_1973183 [Mycena sp. CBHHK59/15]|nr:hypothetical protein B0H10DRAFT_1973183 [Mycena sp. CBHHK59/15]